MSSASDAKHKGLAGLTALPPFSNGDSIYEWHKQLVKHFVLQERFDCLMMLCTPDFDKVQTVDCPEHTQAAELAERNCQAVNATLMLPIQKKAEKLSCIYHTRKADAAGQPYPACDS
jgi:hypothetical protein